MARARADSRSIRRLDVRPVWSPDGTRIVFMSNRTGGGDLYQKLTSGAGTEERLVTSDQLKNAYSWSPDGRFLLFNSTDPQTNTDLWVVPMAGDRTPSVFLKTPFREVNGVFSPDGRWVAYGSNESGRQEIYVRPFVPPRVTLRRARPRARLGASGRCRRRAAPFPFGGPMARNCITSTRRAP